MANDWFYLNGEEQVGPYPGEQLHELISAETITRETLIWTEGMPEWLPAEQIENLFPVAEAQPQATAPAQLAVQPQVAAVHESQPQQTIQERLYPYVSVTKANFKLFLTFAIIIPVAVLVIISLFSDTDSAESQSNKYEGLQLALLFVFLISSFIGTIIFFKFLHRAWRLLQPSGQASTTPGKAVGFCFVPLLNIVWPFFALYGFARDWNRILSTYTDTTDAPRMTEGIFLTFCICNVVFPFVNVILLPIAVAEMCKAINYMNARSVKTRNAAPGGLQLY